MGRSWSFGQKISFGFAALVGLTLLTSVIAAYALNTTVAAMDRTIGVYARAVILSKELDAALSSIGASARGYLLVPDEAALKRVDQHRQQFAQAAAGLREIATTPEELRILDEIEHTRAGYQEALEHILALRRDTVAIADIAADFDRNVRPKFLLLLQAIATFSDHEERLLATEKQAASDTAVRAVTLALTIAVAAAAAGILLAVGLTAALKRQIGSAVQHIQSSSAELQSAATQQASGSKEQATAMNEITVTVQELLATAKQIAESAQRVAKIAEDTAGSARSGDQTVVTAQEAVSSIKRQVDQIVTHMMDLGKKSQQIGGILEIINELAEQTNILSINASIEAAGAGEVGKRFGAVADEIRKLADRVGASTKEIRTLIDEVRAAVHTTIMATESGVKTVDAGTRQFSEVASAFKRIVTMVGTTTEAAREIELSTKQQSSAVEQVNIATANVAQAAKEAETSSLQTVQTASDLAKLSHDLTLLIQPQVRT